jgi:glycosyltransferase involved in cell wall biosynthesis
MIPAVPYNELLSWTTSADLGLTIFKPGYTRSIRYCLPNKLFEYLMAGLPVLSSQLDAIAEVLKTYEVGDILPSLAPEDVGTAINAMLADGAKVERMRQNALKAARDEFHWEKEKLKLVAFYKQVVEKSKKSLGK